MPKGSIETLQTGFRACVYAGKDPITGKPVYVRGDAHPPKLTRRRAQPPTPEQVAALLNAPADCEPSASAFVFSPEPLGPV